MKYLTVFAVIIICAGDEVLVPMGKTNDRWVVPSDCKNKIRKSSCDYYVSKGYCKQRYVPYMNMNCCQSCKDADKPKKPKLSDTRAVDVGCLESANKFRKRHQQTGMLVWDKTLAQKAQKYARFLADKNTGVSSIRDLYFEHDPDNKVYRNGENLYFFDTWKQSTDVEACILADKGWYKEINNWDFHNSSKRKGTSKATGHFTQMIWKRTTKVGYGIARAPSKGSNKMTFVVAKYQEPGNMRNWYKTNVMPLKKK